MGYYLGQCEAWDDERQQIVTDTVVLARFRGITKHDHRQLQKYFRESMGTRSNPTHVNVRFDDGNVYRHHQWYAGSGYLTGAGWPFPNLKLESVTEWEQR